MKLTVQTFLTLDGVMQAPGGPDEDPTDDFIHGGWQALFPDPAVGAFVTELNSHASAFLFGRRTFDIFRGHWPDQTDPGDPIATAINSLPKYVVSNSLGDADATWRGHHPDTARLVTSNIVATVRALKDEPGDELQIWGSGILLQTLLQLDRGAAVDAGHPTSTGREAAAVTAAIAPCAQAREPARRTPISRERRSVLRRRVIAAADDAVPPSRSRIPERRSSRRRARAA